MDNVPESINLAIEIAKLIKKMVEKHNLLKSQFEKLESENAFLKSQIRGTK